MNGGRCNSESSGCVCSPGWTGITCNESEYSALNSFERQRLCPGAVTLKIGRKQE